MLINVLLHLYNQLFVSAESLLAYAFTDDLIKQFSDLCIALRQSLDPVKHDKIFSCIRGFIAFETANQLLIGRSSEES